MVSITYSATLHNDPGHRHAILISLLRALAALQVVAAHVRAQFYPSLRSVPDPALWFQALAFFTGFAHQAVVLFFVLSGYLVGGSLLQRRHQPGAIGDYALDRLTRLWLVLLPAFGLTLALGVASGAADPGRPELWPRGEYSLATLAGNLAGLQDMAVPRYGGNFALWSLANEIWYYAMFPLLVLAWTARTLARRGACALALGALACLLPFDLVLYFAIWLLGAIFARIRVDASLLPQLAAGTLLLALSIWFRLAGSNDILVADSFGQDLILSVLFLLLLASLRQGAGPLLRRLAAPAAACAAFSFTLYVTHVPLLLAVRGWQAPLDPAAPGDLALYLLIVAGLVLFAWLFHLPFEAQTVRLRRWLRTWRTRRATGLRRSPPG